MEVNTTYRSPPRVYMAYNYQVMVPLVPVHEWIYRTPSCNGSHPCRTPHDEPSITCECVENPRPGVYIIHTRDGPTMKIGNNPDQQPPCSPPTSPRSQIVQRDLLRQKYHAREAEWTAAEALLDLSRNPRVLPPMNNRQQAATPKLRGYLSKAVRRLADYFEDDVDESANHPDEILLDGQYDDITDSEASDWDTDDLSGTSDWEETTDDEEDYEDGQASFDYSTGDELLHEDDAQQEEIFEKYYSDDFFDVTVHEVHPAEQNSTPEPVEVSDVQITDIDMRRNFRENLTAHIIELFNQL